MSGHPPYRLVGTTTRSVLIRTELDQEPKSVEIHAEVNIFPEDNFREPFVTVEPIYLDIRAFLKSSI